MSDEETEDEEDMTVMVEYTPMEMIAGLQLLDYMDLMFLEEGMPMGIIGVHRRKMLEALLKEDIYDNIEMEREKHQEKFEEMFGERMPEPGNDRSGFR